MNELPRYVQNALNQWDSISYFAYDCYEKVGRVAVGIEADPNNPAGARLLAFQHDFQNGKPDKKTAHILASYDPENEIVIQFMQDNGQVRTQRLKTAPGARHPKRVFFLKFCADYPRSHLQSICLSCHHGSLRLWKNWIK